MHHRYQHDCSRSDLTALLRVAQAAEFDDTPAMNEIVKRFEPLAKKYAGGLSKKTPDIYDDLLNAGRYAVVQAVRKHDGRPGFPALAGKYVRGAVYRTSLSILQERGELVSLAFAEDVASTHVAQEGVDDRLAPFGTGRVAVSIAEMQSEQKTMLVLRYVYDAEMKEIARFMGVSVPAISQRFATMHRHIRTAYES